MEQLGPYRLDRHLASGGMADVWLATQEGPEGFRKEVVIKRIRGLRSDDDDFRTMFLDEARLTARLNHPNIVQIHELGEQDGEFFVAMEYVEGCDLADILQRDGSIPWHLALHIAEQLLLALIFVSELEVEGEPLDIVHRDISPSNVLLSKTGHVKLADFGVAKALSNHHRTQTGATKGKLSYMSPEQVRADSLDVRSDLFTLGVNLYEWISGTLPFGDGVRALHDIQAEPHQPIEAHADVPASVTQLIDRALAKAPSDRFSSAEEMHDAIIEIFRSEPVHADRRDIAELVEIGPVARTEPAVPAVLPTKADDSLGTTLRVQTGAGAEESGSDEPAGRTATPTAVVGSRRSVEGPVSRAEPEPSRKPARLPWILIGVLFGMLIAGGVSAVALMDETSDSGDATFEAPDDQAQDDQAPDDQAPDDQPPASEQGSPGENPAASDRSGKKRGPKAGHDKANRDRTKKRPGAKKRDERERAEKKRAEKERERRRKRLEKRMERERKKLEKKAREAAEEELERLFDD